jgi:hypothetical protein
MRILLGLQGPDPGIEMLLWQFRFQSIQTAAP